MGKQSVQTRITGKIQKVLAFYRHSLYNNGCSAPAGVMELVDVVDSKSTAGDSVPVRVRPPAPRRSKVRFAPTSFYACGQKDVIRPPPCSSFPTATRCAGLAVGVLPCGRLLFGKISILTLPSKPEQSSLCSGLLFGFSRKEHHPSASSPPLSG